MHKRTLHISSAKHIHSPVVPLGVTIKPASVQLLLHTLTGLVASGDVFASAVVAFRTARSGLLAVVVSASAYIGTEGREA
jgi:hypothetical protein